MNKTYKDIEGACGLLEKESKGFWGDRQATKKFMQRTGFAARYCMYPDSDNNAKLRYQAEMIFTDEAAFFCVYRLDKHNAPKSRVLRMVYGYDAVMERGNIGDFIKGATLIAQAAVYDKMVIDRLPNRG